MLEGAGEEKEEKEVDCADNNKNPTLRMWGTKWALPKITCGDCLVTKTCTDIYIYNYIDIVCVYLSLSLYIYIYTYMLV